MGGLTWLGHRLEFNALEALILHLVLIRKASSPAFQDFGILNAQDE